MAGTLAPLLPRTSQGENWEPLNLTSELQRRLHVLEVAEHDPELQADLRERCRRDVVYFLDNFGWTYDPRHPDSAERRLPLVLYPFQARTLRGMAWCLANAIRSVTLKSRDMGATWIAVGFDVHGFLFETGYKAAFGSRKEDYLDRSGDPDCIFWKIRFMLDNVPGWLLPMGYTSAHMRVSNPANGSAITGEAGRNIGRGGRNRRYTVDESAFIEDPGSVDRALSENTNCRNDTSTPNGPAGPFAELAQRPDAHEWVDVETAERERPTLVKFTLHWTEHPEKDQAWYERKKIALGDPVIVAQELDIDFAASVDGIAIPAAWVNPSVGIPLYLEEKGAICIGLDVAEFGSDKSALVIREGANIPWGEEWQGHELTYTAQRAIGWANMCESRLAEHHHLWIFVDAVGVGAGVASIIAEHIKTAKKTRWKLVRVNAGATTQDPRCARLKDSLWWKLRDYFLEDGKPKGWHRPAISERIPRPVARKLASELSTLRYTFDVARRVVVESKESLKKRGIKSPNLGDALALTFYQDKQKAPEPPKTRPWEGVEHDARFAA